MLNDLSIIKSLYVKIIYFKFLRYFIKNFIGIVLNTNEFVKIKNTQFISISFML